MDLIEGGSSIDSEMLEKSSLMINITYGKLLKVRALFRFLWRLIWTFV